MRTAIVAVIVVVAPINFFKYIYIYIYIYIMKNKFNKIITVMTMMIIS